MTQLNIPKIIKVFVQISNFMITILIDDTLHVFYAVTIKDKIIMMLPSISYLITIGRTVT